MRRNTTRLPPTLLILSKRRYTNTATEAQTNANRRNAKKSTGPRTAEGKAASSSNGIPRPPRTNQHLLEDEDPGELLLLLQDLFNRFRPVGEDEEKLVLRIGLNQWRLDRATPLEAAIYRDRFHGVAAKDELRQRMYDIDKEAAEKDGKQVPLPPTPPTPPGEGHLLARAFTPIAPVPSPSASSPATKATWSAPLTAASAS